MKEQSLDLTGQQFMLVIGQMVLCMATGDTLIVMVVYCLLEDGVKVKNTYSNLVK